MLFHWFVDSLSWRDQTDPALHLKKTDCASICAPIHFEWKPTEWIGSHLGSFLFKLYFFFYLYSIFLPSLLFLESRPAASPPLYISLFFHNLINRKQIPLLWKKRGMHTSLDCFSSSLFFILILGTFLRHWRLAPLLSHLHWSNEEREKEEETTDLCADTTQQQQQHNVSPCNSTNTNQPFSFFLFFPFPFQYFLACLRGPFYFYLSFHTSKQYVGTELRPSCQTRNPTNRYALH